MPVGKTRIIKIVDYDPQWSLTFIALERVIENALGDKLGWQGSTESGDSPSRSDAKAPKTADCKRSSLA